MPLNGIVQAQRAGFRQLSNRQRRERLGERSNRERRSRGDGPAVPVMAEASPVHDLPTLDDGDGHAGNPRSVDFLLNIAIDAAVETGILQ